MAFSPKVLSSTTILAALLGTATLAAGGFIASSPTWHRGATDRAASKVSGNEDSISVGFIGFGTIGSAIARGIATQTAVKVGSIAVSRRSKAKSSAVAAEFPDLVTVHDDNQEILDKSDVVFVCVLPSQGEEVLGKLNFDKQRHQVVSLLSTAKVPEIVKYCKLATPSVSKMICLPSVANHQGVCLHCAPAGTHPKITALFGAMGGVVTLKDEKQLAVSMMTTCVMGPMYGLMRSGREWLVKKGGLSREDASYLMTKQCLGMLQDADNGCDNASRLDDLIAEQTPGGINEQALANLEKLGGLEGFDKMMDAILGRIEGSTDGSV